MGTVTAWTGCISIATKKEFTMKKYIAAAFSAFVLMGCSTVSGFGQDVEDTGEKIEETAESNR